MVDQILSDLTERLSLLSKNSRGVSCQDFKCVLTEMPTSDIPIDAWYKITNFTSEQLGFWEAEWFFSWAHSPNTNAQSEMQEWKVVCRACLDALKDKIPTAVDQLEKQHDLIVLRYSIKRAADYNESTPFRKFKATALSTTSFKLNNIGFHRFASYLYALALYPKGTVGRANK